MLFKELLDGDYRKIEASANEDPEEGGGARDLRFNYEAFNDFVGQMLTGRETVDREGGDTIYVGEVEYAPGNKGELVWEPAYNARNEGRLRRVHQSPAFRVAPDIRNESVFVLIVQMSEGPLRIHYVRESDLRDGRSGLDPQIAHTIANCLDETRSNRQNWATKGYVDLTSDEVVTYCHT